MAKDDLVQDPEELEEDEKRRVRVEDALASGAFVPATGRDAMLRVAATNQPERPAAHEEGLGPAPELTGLHPIGAGSGDLSAPIAPAAPKTLPNLDFKERQALPTISPGAPFGSSAFYRNEGERLEDQRANPWGSAENHPGVLGRIGHIAGKIGNIAGDIFAPGVAAAIPGSDLNRRLEENAAGRRLGEAETRESETGLRTAQQRRAEVETAEAQKKLSTTEQTLERDAQGNVVGWKDAKGLHAIDSPDTPKEIQDIADASANKVLPTYKTNESTGEVTALRFDPKTGKTSAEVVYKGDPKIKTETKDVMRNGQLHAVIFDVTNPLNSSFGKELKDLGETKLPGESPAEKEGMQTVQYLDKDGKLRIGNLADAKEAGGTKIRKVGEGEEQKARTAITQYGRLIDNAQSASDSMAAWDNPKDKELAVRIKNDFFAHAVIPGVGISPEYLNNLANSDDMKSLTPAGQEHMQNMLQLYSDAINMMKLETGGVPRGEAFLKTEGAILPQPEKTQAQNRQALKQFENRIRTDAKEYPTPDDMGPLHGVIPPDATHRLKDKAGHVVGYTDASGKDVYW